MNDPIISVSGLSKRFGDFVAVDRITFEVGRGEIFGFLGANGAGKTTAMRMLCGLSYPTSGSGTVAGYDVMRQGELIKRRIGYMSQRFSLYDDLTVLENMRLYGGIYGLTRMQILRRAVEVLDRLDFRSETGTLVGSLPLGWKQKLAFSVAALHRPEVIFLDEPTGGSTRDEAPVLGADLRSRGRRDYGLRDNALHGRGGVLFARVDHGRRADPRPGRPRLPEKTICRRVDGRGVPHPGPRCKTQRIMGGFLSFVKKEMLHILRDRRTMLIVLGIPVMQLLLFGFAISVEINNIDFAVVAPHPTAAVRQQVERLAANPYFTFRGYVTQAEADGVLRAGRADAVVAFAGDYDRLTADAERAALGEKAVQLVFDASNPNTASVGAGYMQSILLAGQQSGAATPETRLLYNPQMKSAYNFVPGIMGLIFILICAMMTSVSIVREKETGTMEVLLVSPVRPIRIIFAKMIPYFLLSCFNLVTILLLARFVLGMPVAGSVAGLVGMSLLYLLLALALGLFISTVADTQVTAMLVSGMLLMLPVIMLSGMVFPIENMPGVLQWVSCVIPARWYIDAVRKLMIEGLPFRAVLREFFILAGMTAVLIGVALKKFNDKLE